jgi:hypothetical protein
MEAEIASGELRAVAVMSLYAPDVLDNEQIGGRACNGNAQDIERVTLAK